MDQVDELGFGLVCKKTVNFLSHVLRHGAFIIIRFIIPRFIFQLFQALVTLFCFGDGPVVLHPFQVLDHHRYPVLAVQFERACAGRTWQTVFIHDHPRGIALRTVHPGNQAAIIRHGQARNMSPALIILTT